MALDNVPNGRLTPLGRLPGSDPLFVQTASYGALTHPLAPPLENEPESRGLSRVLDTPPINQTESIGSGADTDPGGHAYASELAFGVRSERHAPTQERLPDRSLRDAQLAADRA
jgi:hypothetical protein